MKKNNNILIILGPPCSGKGTQCALLEKLKFKTISIGNILRSKATKDSTIRKLIDRGMMVPNNIILDILSEHLTVEGRYILDGYPRTKKQAECFYENYKNNFLFIKLEIQDSLLITRMRQRTNCLNCGHSYSASALCCGSKTIKRKDDNLEAFKLRLDTYHDNISHILPNQYATVDASQSTEAIHDEIVNILRMNKIIL